MKERNFSLLLPLQELDKKIYDLNKIIEQEPRKLDPFQNKLSLINKEIQEADPNLKEIELKKKNCDLDISTIDEKIQKLKTQVTTAKKLTNEEYQSMLKQISGYEADKKVIEDKWLEYDIQIEQSKKLLSSKKQDMKELEASVASKKKEIETEISSLNTSLEELISQRNETLKSIDPTLLDIYTRVINSENTDGTALAKVIQQPKKKKATSIEDYNYSCSGCSVEFTTQDVNKILIGTEIVQCRNCSRIIYFAEQLQYK